MEGFVRVHMRQGSGEIVGATLVASHAGEIISELTPAICRQARALHIARTIHPYPQTEAIRKIGDAYNRSRLTPRVTGSSVSG